MGKKLHLAVAELTDVGRKRERNQDNVTYLVPQDDETLERAGAIFIVCDGMGGHAAGEVAAEIGVETLRDTYYGSREREVISRIASAVKGANQRIYSYAHEHPEYAGMGTTCVSMLVQGGRGFVVNIGDSRAYLFRDGAMRQITMDHSWVAEQVRAGVLTEEQARTHAHRNVITRSLGTQPTVTADLFVEPLQDGDRVLLCSDGLHGYVDEREIARELGSPEAPDVIVQHLVDMANANGGPDNITALVVQVLETPAATEPLSLPTLDDDAEQPVTSPLPAIGKTTTPAGATAAAASVAPAAAASAAPAALTTAPESKRGAERRGRRASEPRRRAGAGTVILRLLTVATLAAIVAVLAAGAWDYTLGPYGMTRAATDQLNGDIASAQREVAAASSQDPTTALAALASSHDHLVADLGNPNLDATDHRRGQDALDTLVTPAIRDTVQRYNQAAHITPLVSASATYSVACGDPNNPTPLTNVSALTAIATPRPSNLPSGVAGVQALYALSGNALYTLLAPLDANGAPQAGSAICQPVGLPNNATPLALTHDGATLYLLVQLPNNGGYAVHSVSFDGLNDNGTPKVTPKQLYTFSLNAAPTAIAAQGDTVYISFKDPSANTQGVQQFSGQGSNGSNTPAKTIQLTTLAQPVTSLALLNGTLYMLAADGSVGQLDPSSQYLQLQVSAPPPVYAGAPTVYTSATPAPTVPTSAPASGNAGPPLFGKGATLASDPAASGALVLNDRAQRRVALFTPKSPAPGLDLTQQYVYTAPGAGALALVTNTPQPPPQNGGASTVSLDTYLWSGSSLIAYSAAQTPARA